MSRRYTAKEMREMAIEAEVIEVADQFHGHDMDTIAAMLRQAADEKVRLDSILDAIEKEFKKQSTCRSCEWRGKSIRSEPACPCDKDENFSVYEIDIIDRLRKAVYEMEREKKYEYTAEYVKRRSGKIISKCVYHFASFDEAKRFKYYPLKGEKLRFVRRAVGDWEDVNNA